MINLVETIDLIGTKAKLEIRNGKVRKVNHQGKRRNRLR